MALFIRYLRYEGTDYTYEDFEETTRDLSLSTYSITLKSAFPKRRCFYFVKSDNFTFDDIDPYSTPSSLDVLDAYNIADMPYMSHRAGFSFTQTITSSYLARRIRNYLYSDECVRDRTSHSFLYNYKNGRELPLAFSFKGCRPIAGSNIGEEYQIFSKNWFLYTWETGATGDVLLYNDHHTLHNSKTGISSNTSYSHKLNYIYVFLQASADSGGEGSHNTQGAGAGAGGAALLLLRFVDDSHYYKITGLYGSYTVNGSVGNMVITSSKGGSLTVYRGTRGGSSNKSKVEGSFFYNAELLWERENTTGTSNSSNYSLLKLSPDDIYNITFSAHSGGSSPAGKGGGASVFHDGGNGGGKDECGENGFYGAGAGGGGKNSFWGFNWGGSHSGGWNSLNLVTIGY